MKKLVLMMALMIGTTAFAQERNPDKKRMSSEAKIEKLTKELDLTADQQNKAKILFEQKAEAKKAKKEGDKDVAEMKAKRERFDAEFRSILTDEQIQKYDAKKERMKEKHGDKFSKKGKKTRDGARAERSN